MTRCDTVLTMPRISGRSSLTTTSPIRFRPSERMRVALAVGAADDRLSLRDLEASHHELIPAARAFSRPSGATSSSGSPRRAATCSGRSRLFRRRDRRVDDVDGVGRPERLAQDVMDAGGLEHGAHRTTGNHTGTGRQRASGARHQLRPRPEPGAGSCLGSEGP